METIVTSILQGWPFTSVRTIHIRFVFLNTTQYHSSSTTHRNNISDFDCLQNTKFESSYGLNENELQWIFVSKPTWIRIPTSNLVYWNVCFEYCFCLQNKNHFGTKWNWVESGMNTDHSWSCKEWIKGNWKEWIMDKGVQTNGHQMINQRRRQLQTLVNHLESGQN